MNIFINRKKFASPRILIPIIVLVLFIGFLNLFSQQLKNIFYFVSSPVQKTFWNAGASTSAFTGAFLNALNLSGKNDQLVAENQKLLVEVASLQDSLRTREALKEMSANNPQNDLQAVLANTIGFDSVHDSILLDKGSVDGILENMTVIDSSKVLYGKVAKVYKNYSKVMMLSDKNSVVDVKIQNTDTAAKPILGVVIGKGSLSLFLDLIPNNCEINSNDILITSALEGTFPKGLLVGKITSCNKNDQKPFQQAQVEPFFEINRAEKLFVITNYKIEK